MTPDVHSPANHLTDERGFMGLDVSAYNNLKYLEPLNWDRYEELYEYPDKEVIALHVNSHFPDSSVGVVEGIYSRTEDTEYFGWHAGSYGGYSIFRERLAESTGYSTRECWNDPEKFKDFPFYELVNFSDAEGTIGTEASKALYQDFLDNRQAFVDHIGENLPWGFVERYDDWTKGFWIASNNGYVDLH